MVDTIGLGPIGRKVMGVQVPPPALRKFVFFRIANFLIKDHGLEWRTNEVRSRGPETKGRGCLLDKPGTRGGEAELVTKSREKDQGKKFMSKSILAKTTDGTITLTIPLSIDAIKAAREEVIDHAVAAMEVSGFRKGKAPRNVVEEKLDPLNLKEDILRHLLPKAYSDAVLEHKLKPIMSPKINVSKLDDGKEWEFIATTCEMPEVTLKDYTDAVKNVTAKSKIVVPGKEQKEVSFDEIMQAVMGKSTVVIPSVLIESEVDRLLSQMLDEVKTLGLTLDQYLASTHKTVEEVKKEYAARATNDITVEFVLQKVADEQSLSVSDREIEEAITKAPTPAEKENLEKNKYLLAAILRQQKTFDFLKSL